jgi:hypothetical protein
MGELELEAVGPTRPSPGGGSAASFSAYGPSGPNGHPSDAHFKGIGIDDNNGKMRNKAILLDACQIMFCQKTNFSGTPANIFVHYRLLPFTVKTTRENVLIALNNITDIEVYSENAPSLCLQ